MAPPRSEEQTAGIAQRFDGADTSRRLGLAGSRSGPSSSSWRLKRLAAAVLAAAMLTAARPADSYAASSASSAGALGAEARWGFAASTPRKFGTLRAGARLPSDCGRRVRRNRWEPRPGNYRANHTVGRTVSSRETRTQRQFRRVNGRFTGTTDEILQWAACKWGFNEDLVRAVADTESSWYQSTNGDGGASWGIMQVKVRDYPGTWPAARDSTAFSVDYWGAYVRACYEGNISWIPRRSRGQLWPCVALWYSGSWMRGGARYVSTVRRALRTKPWVELGWPGVTRQRG
jgi:hypothetical protein